MREEPHDLMPGFVNSRILARGKILYDQGDKTQILYCLHWCFIGDVPIPPWLKQAFQNAYGGLPNYKVKSWDDVFGRPFKKGKRPARELYKEQIANDLYKRVVDRHDGGAGEPIDKSLFEAAGKDFGVGGTVASELYYEIRKIDEAFGLLPEKMKKPRKFPKKLKNIRE